MTEGRKTMNHRSAFNRLGRTSAHRKALLRSMATSLFRYERIKTTSAKAKEARRLAEKLITRAKVDVTKRSTTGVSTVRRNRCPEARQRATSWHSEGGRSAFRGWARAGGVTARRPARIRRDRPLGQRPPREVPDDKCATTDQERDHP